MYSLTYFYLNYSEYASILGKLRKRNQSRSGDQGSSHKHTKSKIAVLSYKLSTDWRSEKRPATKDQLQDWSRNKNQARTYMRAIDPIAIPIAVPIVAGVASREIHAVCKLMIALSASANKETSKSDAATYTRSKSIRNSPHSNTRDICRTGPAERYDTRG